MLVIYLICKNEKNVVLVSFCSVINQKCILLHSFNRLVSDLHELSTGNKTFDWNEAFFCMFPHAWMNQLNRKKNQNNSGFVAGFFPGSFLLVMQVPQEMI